VKKWGVGHGGGKRRALGTNTEKGLARRRCKSRSKLLQRDHRTQKGTEAGKNPEKRGGGWESQWGGA